METNGETNIIAFNGLQRWFHKHIIHFMVIFIITGLPIFSTKFSFLASFFLYQQTLSPQQTKNLQQWDLLLPNCWQKDFRWQEYYTVLRHSCLS